MASSDFYIGYQSHAPAPLAGFLRRVVVGLLLGGAGIAVVLVLHQGRFDPGVFEYGIVREFEGVIRETPVPLLLADPPVVVGEEAASRFFLVAFGKHGAAAQVAGLDGRRVRLRGSLIYREGEMMIEVAAGSIEALGSKSPAPAASVDLGTLTLRGEIVDSKCFFGVMKPGRGKPHRSCAARCISGGVPPVLRVETEDGDFRHFLLVDEAGGVVNDRVLDFVAEPVEITGRVLQDGDLLILYADVAGYRRLVRRSSSLRYLVAAEKDPGT